MDNEWLYRLALTNVKLVGPITGRGLIQHYGTASAVMQAPLKDLRHREGIGEIKAKAFKDPAVMERAEAELTYISKHNITPIWIDDDAYPHRLKNCVDAPLVLYYKGSANLNAGKMIAIVGTRKHTDYGRQLTEELVEGLAEQEDIIIVSGLADGIDTIAHKAAVQKGIPTVGVLGHGHDKMYPAHNKALAKEMQEQGGVLTEFPSGTIPDRENFPMRNRIVAGMSDVTVVVESDINGGSLITARIASGYNREVAAFPGKVTDKRSAGCNELIKSNIAGMITNAGDLLEMMNWGKAKKKPAVQKQLFINLTTEEKMLMNLLDGKGAVHADELYRASGMSSSQLAAILLQLEMQGLVKTLPGKMYRVS